MEEQIINPVEGSHLTIKQQVMIHDGKRNRPHYVCVCSCGKEVTVRKYLLLNGNTLSCGHLQRERARDANTTHGMYRTAEYNIWSGIIGRCTNPNDSAYKDYGGRGIRMCERWRTSFQSFYEDMGPRPSNAYTVERLNSNGDYEPDNCKWATRTEQNRNTSRNRVITYQDKTQCLSAWVEELGVDRNRFNWLIRKGYSDVTALDRLCKERDVGR